MCKLCNSGLPGVFNIKTQRNEIVEHLWAHIQEAADRGDFWGFKLAADEVVTFGCTFVHDPLGVTLTDTVAVRVFNDSTILVGRGSITRRRSRNRVL